MNKDIISDTLKQQRPNKKQQKNVSTYLKRPRVFLKVAGMNKGASDFDAIYTEVDEMLNLGLKLVNEHISTEGDAKQELTQQVGDD